MQVRVRAHFSYKASDDPETPCKEAGLDFDKGDVLHIVSQDDHHWYAKSKIQILNSFNIIKLQTYNLKN